MSSRCFFKCAKQNQRDRESTRAYQHEQQDILPAHMKRMSGMDNHFFLLLLIYDLQSEDWINTYYMVRAI